MLINHISSVDFCFSARVDTKMRKFLIFLALVGLGWCVESLLLLSGKEEARNCSLDGGEEVSLKAEVSVVVMEEIIHNFANTPLITDYIDSHLKERRHKRR
jgi:hypothetical protein